MNLYDVLNKLNDIANKHKLISEYHNGDVYRIMNSAKNTYPVVVFTVDMLQNYEDYSTLNAYMYFIDRLTDDEDNKINIQTNGINTINDIINKLCEVNEISVQRPLQYTFFTEKFGDMCCGVYANVSIQFNNYSNCCENFNINTLDISENGEYILDNIDVVNVNVQLKSSTITITENGVYNPADYQTDYFNEVTVDVQPALQNKALEYTENGEYSVTNDEEFYGLKEVKINVAIPNVSTAVTITENGTMTLTPDNGYYNQVDIDVNVQPALESKTVDITQNGTMNITPDSAYGLSNVTVNTNVQPPLQEKVKPIGINERLEITPDTEYYGLSKVTVQSPDVPLQNKTLNVTQNGSTRLLPDEGYYALNTVDVNVNVPNPELESKYVRITDNGLTIIEPDSAYGLSKVSVHTNVQPKLQDIDITITENGSTEISKDDSYDGFGTVLIITNVQPALQNKTLEYTENGQYSVTNDEGFYGLKEAKINVSIPNVSTAVTITENGTTTLRPESGYYNQVDIDVQVPDPALESKTVDITANGTMNITPDSAYGLSNVTVNTNVQPALESKTVEITQNGLTYIAPDSAYYGLSNVTVNTNIQPALQEKEIFIGINEIAEITPDIEYYGLSKVVVQSPNVPLQNKTLNVTENGGISISPDEGYYALHTVDVNVNVPQPTLESKTVDITSNGTTNIAPDSADGLSNVTVNTNVQPTLQNKSVTITENGTQTITKDDGYDGLGNVTVTTNVAGGGGGSSNPNVITVQNPFQGNKILDSFDKTLDISKWNLQIGAYNRTFEGMNFINKIILPIDFLNLINGTNIIENYLFQNCTNLVEIENIDKTRICINEFLGTFKNCSSLTSLDLSYKPEYNYWDMSGVDYIDSMFYGCTNLTTLNIDGWDRAKIAYSQNAFYKCSKLGGIIRLSAHNAIYNEYMFEGCSSLEEIYYDNDGYDNKDPDNEVCNMMYFAGNCTNLKKVSIKGRNIYRDQQMFINSTNIEWVDMTGCDYSKYLSGDTATTNIQPYRGCTKLKTLIGDHTLQEVENGDITIYNGLGISQTRFKAYYFSPLSSLRYSSMLALAKGLGQHTYSTTQYIRLNQTAWNNMYNDDDTIPDSNTITSRQNTLTDLITGKGWRIQYSTN